MYITSYLVPELVVFIERATEGLASHGCVHCPWWHKSTPNRELERRKRTKRLFLQFKFIAISGEIRQFRGCAYWQRGWRNPGELYVHTVPPRTSSTRPRDTDWRGQPRIKNVLWRQLRGGWWHSVGGTVESTAASHGLVDAHGGEHGRGYGPSAEPFGMSAVATRRA